MVAGLKQPQPKKAKTTASAPGSTTDNNTDKAKTKPKKQASDNAKVASKNDVSMITLEGESNRTVPIYDTCDDMRTKINRYMREMTGATNAGFVRTVNSAANPMDTIDSFRPATASQLTTFLKGKGPTKGCESPVFYAAYVFFEKLRVKEGKPKSKKRVEMEAVWEKAGMKLIDASVRGVWALRGQTPYEDKYGKLYFA